MKLRFGMCLIIGSLSVAPSLSYGQTGKVDLMDHVPTRGELVSAMKPETRGLYLGPASCAILQEKNRGIELKPIAKVPELSVRFAVNSAELSPDASQTLDQLGAALKSDDLKYYCFRIEGYTDAKGSNEYNLSLSQRRAQAVLRYLSSHADIEKERLMAEGYGKKNPIAPNDTDEGRQKNRRVQIANLGHD